MSALDAVCWTQVAYFGATGLWPLLHYPSFAAVTGPKKDVWLVRTVGALIVVVALALTVSVARGRIDAATVTLATGSAAALALVDVISVSRGLIARIYLADAMAEVGLIAWWSVALVRSA